MGQSPTKYTSTHVESHQAKFVKHFSKDFRLRETEKNSKTNFVHLSGFEKQIDQGSFG